ncbi:hypothetical protein [Methanobrevibacter sp.]|uniref:hypothetical protein n=1 Tax=Methanobrevibacter sp. TaxID=66852 RepID=UPI00388FF0F2
MDKRYLLILVVIIICGINLSIIVNNSDIVGSASVSVGKYLFSMPEGFNIYENNGNSIVIQNKDKITIYFDTNLGSADNYDKRLKYIDNTTTDKILSKGTLTIDNIKVDSVYYQNENHTNMSAFYFEKDNNPFKIVVSNFNYNDDRNLTLEYITDIIQSTHLDYKTN